MSAPKFTSVEAFLAARQVWKPDPIDGDVDPSSPPTVPKTKSEAARRFLCKLLKIQLDGADCAARCVRISVRKDSATLCFGCPAGEARAQLLDVTTASLDQRREEQKQAASKASKRDDEKKVAELNKRVTLDSLRKPKATAPRRRPSKPAEAARQVGRKAQAGARGLSRLGQPTGRKAKTAATPSALAVSPPPATTRKPKIVTRKPDKVQTKWDRVDLTRPVADLMAELGVSANAVYLARRRRSVRVEHKPSGEGWHAQHRIADASPIAENATCIRLRRLAGAGELERAVVQGRVWYRPISDAGRAELEALLDGRTVPRLKRQRVDWSGVDLLRPIQDLCAELGTHPDTIRNRRKQAGVVVPERRPDGRGWRTVRDLVDAGTSTAHAVRRRVRQMSTRGHLERASVANRVFYRPADEHGARWFRSLFDSRPVVTRASVASAPNGLLPMLAKQGAVECLGATNDRAWRVNDADAVRRAGLHIEQRGRTS